MAECTLPLSPGPAVRAGGGILCRRFFVSRLSENRMPHSRMDGEGMLRVSRREGGIKQKNSSDCSNELFSVPRTRLELARTNVHYPLKVACLPISPPGRHCRISHFGCANIELIFETAKFSTDLCRKKDFFRAESAVEAFAGHIPEPRGSLPGPLPAVAGADISTVAAVDAAPRPLRRNGGTVPPPWGERSRSVCAGACHLASGSRTVPPQRTKSISRKR